MNKNHQTHPKFIDISVMRSTCEVMSPIDIYMRFLAAHRSLIEAKAPRVLFQPLHYPSWDFRNFSPTWVPIAFFLLCKFDNKPRKPIQFTQLTFRVIPVRHNYQRLNVFIASEFHTHTCILVSFRSCGGCALYIYY